MISAINSRMGPAGWRNPEDPTAAKTSAMNYDTYCRDGVVMLRDAIKFSCGRDELDLVPVDVTREWLTQEEPQLPFDTVAIEMVGPDTSDRDQITQRIYLCQMLYCTPSFVRKKIFADLDLTHTDEGFLVWPIQKHATTPDGEAARWWFAPCIGVALAGSTLKQWESTHPRIQVHTAKGESEHDTLDNLMHVVDDDGLYSALAAHAREADLDIDPVKMYKSQMGLMGESLQHDMHRAAALFALLETSNVGVKVLSAPLKLNKKRHKKKRTPFFEYRVLEIDLFKPRVATVGVHGDKRESPKMHMRRGHPRTLHNGREIKIPAMIVGDKDKGFILKDYEITPRGGHDDV